MLLGSRFFYIDHIIEKIAFTIFDVDFFYFIHLYTKMMLDSARSKHITSVVISAWHPSISKNRSHPICKQVHAVVYLCIVAGKMFLLSH